MTSESRLAGKQGVGQEQRVVVVVVVVVVMMKPSAMFTTII